MRLVKLVMIANELDTSMLIEKRVRLDLLIKKDHTAN